MLVPCLLELQVPSVYGCKSQNSKHQDMYAFYVNFWSFTLAMMHIFQSKRWSSHAFCLVTQDHSLSHRRIAHLIATLACLSNGKTTWEKVRMFLLNLLFQRHELAVACSFTNRRKKTHGNINNKLVLIQRYDSVMSNPERLFKHLERKGGPGNEKEEGSISLSQRTCVSLFSHKTPHSGTWRALCRASAQREQK